MNRPHLVVIDPGHGGADPGAINPRLVSVYEKNITLSLAQKFKDIALAGDYLFDVKLTRETDSYVSLDDRVKIANSLNADVFLSFHCNAAEDTRAEGFEVWTSLGTTAADILADELFFELKSAMPDHKARVNFDDGDTDKESNFYVLRNTKMPAVLIEFEFISNNEQAWFLINESNQSKLAKAVAEAVEYFLESGGV